MAQPYGDLASYSNKDVCVGASFLLEPPLIGACGVVHVGSMRLGR